MTNCKQSILGNNNFQVINNYIETSTIKPNDEIITDYIDAVKEIIKNPDCVFGKEYIDTLFDKQVYLYKLNNNELEVITESFCEAIKKKQKDYEQEKEKALWNVSRRIHLYLNDGLIESGENIYEIEYQTAEIINSEIREYKKKNTIDSKLVRTHLSEVCKHIN